MKRRHLHLIGIFAFLLSTSMAIAKDYIIYSIMQDIPTGAPGHQVKKNYYLNIGQQQGVSSGTVLDVYRNISVLDPYETKNRFNYKVKIGELKVIHSEEHASIGTLQTLASDTSSPMFDVNAFMIGDKVDVKIK
jgi:hypothetical protein